MVVLRRSRAPRAAAVALFAIVLAACSSGTSPSATSSSGGGGGGTTVDVTLTEFKVEFSTMDIPAGPVTFNVTNGGSVVHEFVVFRTEDAEDALPTNDEGTEVVEDDSSLQSMGEVEDVDPGSSKSFDATLEPGNYVAICNVAGHYSSGMHIHFTVS
jgi:uncharacterized cupredoxin-like copper-binding protein